MRPSSLDATEASKKTPKEIIRDYLAEPDEESTLFDGVYENGTKLLEGVNFSLGIFRLRTWLMILLTVMSTYACR